jgi:hypothetical protein
LEQANNNQRGGAELPIQQVDLEALSVPRGIRLEYGYLSPIPPEGDSWDTWVIERGIAAALRDDRDIDDRTARYIASQLHEGQASALYSLASTGNIEEPVIHDELTHDFDRQSETIKRWINWLGFYCLNRADKGPVEGWTRQAAAQDRADLELLRRNQTIAELDGLFGEQANEEIGDVSELGWFGLVRHEGRPGGIVLAQDEQGFRDIWETDSDAELQQRWEAVNDEYGRFYDEREERERGGRPGAEATSRADRPERLADLEERLAPLPDLGDIPHPGEGLSSGSGYGWIERLSSGWHAEPSWGRDGWDLGAWPLVVVALFVDEDRGRYAAATYTESDVTVNRYRSRSALHAAVNDIAEFHWRLGQSLGPGDLPEGHGLLAKHCGPYSEARREREVAAERGERDGMDQTT